MPKLKTKASKVANKEPATAPNKIYTDPKAPSADRRPLVDPNEANPLGGANREELAAVVADTFGGDPNYEASEIAIAIDSLSRVIAARMAHNDWANDPKQLAVFVVSDRVRDLAGILNATREPILDNGSRGITGKLWIAGPTFASGYYATFLATDSAGVFEEIRTKGVGDRAALVFDPSATDPEIRYYPDGLNQDERVHRFSIANEVFSLTALDKVLKQFHEFNIITPDAALPNLNPWSEGAKYFPCKDTEALLQGMLKMALSIAFGKCRVDFEVRGTEGRCDLLISARSATVPNGWVSHAALELKVLRSFTSGGNSVSRTARARAVTDGVVQVIAYRRERDADEGMLCCFDMCLPKHCSGDTIFKNVITQAKRNKIQLRSYRLYGTSADLRKDKYGTESPAT